MKRIKGMSQWLIFRILPDKIYLFIFYLYRTKHILHLKHPVLFNEKLQWLKLNERKDIFTVMTDKYLMKDYVREKIGSGHTFPTLQVWEKANEINLDNLPEQFVLKCNHDSHSIQICKDKKRFDLNLVKKKLAKKLKRNYFWYGREWPYKNIKPLIIAEPLMKDENQKNGLYDYKFFCFNGIPKIMYISNDNADEVHTDFFDMDYNRLNLRMRDPNSENPPDKPKQFEEMKEYARILSEGTKHLRVDFYIVNSTVYVGELTFFHNSGIEKIQPEEWNLKLGNWIEIQQSKENEAFETN